MSPLKLFLAFRFCSKVSKKVRNKGTLKASKEALLDAYMTKNNNIKRWENDELNKNPARIKNHH